MWRCTAARLPYPKLPHSAPLPPPCSVLPPPRLLACSWNDFLRGTNRLFNGRELCDCFRADWVPGSGWKPPEDEKHENRFYRRRLGGAGGDIFGGWRGLGQMGRVHPVTCAVWWGEHAHGETRGAGPLLVAHCAQLCKQSRQLGFRSPPPLASPAASPHPSLQSPTSPTPPTQTACMATTASRPI